MDDNNNNSKRIPKISNIIIYPENVKRARVLIMNGMKGFKIDDFGQVGDTVFAATSIGNCKKDQEDAVMLLTHPKNPDFKMLLVADGRGGPDCGEIASSMAVKSSREWFECLDEKYYMNPSELKNVWTKKIRRLSSEIFDALEGKGYEKERGTTYCGAIVGMDLTLIANVGNSRAYTFQDGKLTQVTIDDSVAQNLFDCHVQRFGELLIKTKDDMRFHVDANRLTDYLGMSRLFYEPSYTTLENKKYDVLLLVTEGIKDCLNDKKIMAICQDTNIEELAKKLVYASKNTEPSRKPSVFDFNKFNDYIPAGRNNGTVAISYNPKETDIVPEQ